MSEKVALVGVGMTKLEPRKNETLYDMIFEAASLALADAGMERKDLESVVLAASDLVDGVSISSMVTATAAGAYLKDEIKVADDGMFGLAMAYLRIRSGHFANSIVVGWSKCSQGSISKITNLNFDPFYHRPFALNLVTAGALQATRYADRYGVSEEEAARVVVKNRSNALDNPYACLRSEVAMDEVLSSRVLASPLKEMDLSHFCDGACALVLAGEDQARSLTEAPVWIRGLGWSTGTYYMGDQELAELGSLREAGQKAYAMAGIKVPAEEIDLAEVYDLTSYHQLMALEALNFCPPGQGGKFFAEGSLPINLSGGLIASHPYFASGLIRAAEGALQIGGRAEGRQVPQVELALAHGVSGLCYQKNCVVVLGR